MSIRCVVLDFDGTFTDLAVESLPYTSAFRAALRDLVGRDVRAEWEAVTARIESSPADYGWTFDGYVVAPATADPYLLGNAVMREILDGAALLRDPAVRTAVTQALYGYAYEKTLTCFRPEAREALDGLVALGSAAVTVVTNSKTDVVAAKLDRLGLASRGSLGVVGDAKKYVVTRSSSPRYSTLAEFERSPDLVRPIYLRRGRYLDVLDALWRSGIAPEETLVAGDIYELDLALPAALGCHVALVESARTQRYERERIEHHGGHVIRDLRDLVALAKG